MKIFKAVIEDTKADLSEINIKSNLIEFINGGLGFIVAISKFTFHLLGGSAIMMVYTIAKDRIEMKSNIKKIRNAQNTTGIKHSRSLMEYRYNRTGLKFYKTLMDEVDTKISE